jgi:SAM-dependent methyltransferase
LPLLFAITLFVSSALLFVIQPMFAKMVLPFLGGTPAVWNTCMVFFQAALLAGYAYAHAAPTWLGVRRQTLLHFGLLLLPFVLLPLSIPSDWMPPADANPIPWLLGLLSISVGLPFFVVSTSGPLLQRWFVATGHTAGRDPYFLYSASNLGSMLALLSYPILLEPSFPLATQRWLWTVGYAIFVVLMSVCAVAVWRGARRMRKPSYLPSVNSPAKHAKQRARQQVDSGSRTVQRLRWIALAFVPSSLLLSVTTYLTTDIAAIPLLWVVPLAVYLFSFIIVFAPRPLVPHWAMLRSMPLAVLLITIVMLSQATEPVWILLPLHVLALFIVAMVCHGELARLRPPPERLTEFYLLLSLGGVLGGLFNALLAPLVFHGLVEYPLIIVAACLLRPATVSGEAQDDKTEGFKILLLRGASALTPGLLCALLILVARRAGWDKGLSGGVENQLTLGLTFGLPAVVCYTFLHRPVLFGVSIGGLFLAGAMYQGVYGQTVYQERSFFGIHRVCEDAAGTQYQLVHGNTFHGLQFRDPQRARQPLLYYYRTGPIGQLFATFSGKDAKPEVAVVGLGAGSLAAYGEAGQRFTYYEIDPSVLHIARDAGYFTFLRDSKADVRVILGDARLTLRGAPDHCYGILVIDAFSSDAIPLHLLTREALDLYKEKLAPNGILAFNISNRYLDLEPVLGALAQDAGLLCWAQADRELSDEEKKAGKAPSQWVLMAVHETDVGQLRNGPWQVVKRQKKPAVWTDDFSNIFSVFKWE